MDSYEEVVQTGQRDLLQHILFPQGQWTQVGLTSKQWSMLKETKWKPNANCFYSKGN